MGLFGNSKNVVKDLKTVGESPTSAIDPADPVLAPINGVNLDRYAELSVEIMGLDPAAQISHAATYGVAGGAWPDIMNGWNTRMRGNPAVNRGFNELFWEKLEVPGRRPARPYRTSWLGRNYRPLSLALVGAGIAVLVLGFALLGIGVPPSVAIPIVLGSACLLVLAPTVRVKGPRVENLPNHGIRESVSSLRGSMRDISRAVSESRALADPLRVMEEQQRTLEQLSRGEQIPDSGPMRGMATIVRVLDPGITKNIDDVVVQHPGIGVFYRDLKLDLTIVVDGRAPYPMTIEERVSLDALGHIVPGVSLPVLVDRDDLTGVSILPSWG